MESMGWLVPWSVPILGLEISPSIRREPTFSFSCAGGRKSPTNVTFSICSSGIRFSLTLKSSCQFANSVNEEQKTNLPVHLHPNLLLRVTSTVSFNLAKPPPPRASSGSSRRLLSVPQLERQTCFGR